MLLGLMVLQWHPVLTFYLDVEAEQGLDLAVPSLLGRWAEIV